MTYAEIRGKAIEVERALLRDVLERHGWSVSKASVELEVAVSTAYTAVNRHPVLIDTVRKLGPGRGRPRIER